MLLMSLFACEKEELSYEFINEQWEVVKIKKADKNSYNRTNDSYVIEVVNDNTITFNLDVNNCGSEFITPSKGEIQFDGGYCSYVCCDTDFANDFAQLINTTTSYYVANEKLYFVGEGEIVFRKYEE